jgi:lysophospholipase L1-like esterase
MTTRFALLGDSIAWGQGAARAEDTLAGRLRLALAQHGFDTETRVAAVPGSRSRGLDAQVSAVLPWPPHVALVVIGANDLTHLVPPAAAAADLGRALARLRARDVQVVVAPAPDLGSVPHVPTALRAVVSQASAELRRLQAEQVRAHGGWLADDDHATSRAFAADRSLFSADRFHPSSTGYAAIAAALLPTVLEAVRAAASASATSGAPAFALGPVGEPHPSAGTEGS